MFKNKKPVVKLIPFKRMVKSDQREEFLTEKQMAEIMGRSIYTLQKDRCYGRGVPFVKFGKSVRYRVGDFLDYVHANRVAP